MALADIIGRIEADAAAEALAVTQAAEEAAAKTRAAAETTAERTSVARTERAEREAEAEAQTVRANARLAARDAALAEKRRLIDAALSALADAVVALPDAEYARFLGERIAAGARGGETVRIASADAGRLAKSLPDVMAKAAPSVELTYSPEPAEGIAHGVVLQAERSRVDLSVEAIVEERREELTMLVSRILFGSEGEA